MKKTVSVLCCLLMLLCLAAGALGEGIKLTKRDLAPNRELSRDVTNILFLLQDGDKTDTMMIASIDGKSGRAVMTRVDCLLEIPVMDAGAHAVGDIYALGAEGCGGLLAMRALNDYLGLNLGTYLALDIALLPELVDTVDVLRVPLDDAEAQALGLWEGENELTGEQALSYVRLRLEGDSPARSRGYDALMQLLYQGLHSSDLGSMMSLGMSMLGAMDTNLSPLTAVTLVTSVQGGEDRRELALTVELADGAEDGAKALQDAFYREVYE